MKIIPWEQLPPEMQIEGAALGTLLARIVEFGVIVGYFMFKENKIGFRIKHLFIKCGDLLGEYFRVGFPVLI